MLDGDLAPIVSEVIQETFWIVGDGYLIRYCPRDHLHQSNTNTQHTEQLEDSKLVYALVITPPRVI